MSDPVTPESSSSDAETQAKEQYGSQWLLSLSCPHCGKSGLTTVPQLSRVLRCKACESRFWLNRDGRFHSEHDRDGSWISTSIPFACPRCRHVDQVPAFRAAAVYNCPACDEPFHHSAQGWIPRESAHSQAGKHPRESMRKANQASSLSLYFGRGSLILAALILMVLLLAGLLPLFSSLGTESLESAVEQFTFDCAEGRYEDALSRTSGGDEEALSRWCLVEFHHYPGRPAPTDSVISCRLLRKKPSPRGELVYVELHMRRGGERLILQQWKQQDNHWRFDPQASLQQITSADEEN